MYFFFPWHHSTYWARVSSLWRLLDHTLLDTPHSVGFLWTSDQRIAQSFTWHHTTFTKGRYHAPGRVRNPILANDRLRAHAFESAATGIGISLYKETKVACWMCTGARLNDYTVSNIISIEKYGTVQRTYLYISSDPLRRANTRSDVSSPFHLRWIALGQISQAQGGTSGHDEVHR